MAKLGIDFGTANSAAAIVYRHTPDKAETVEPIKHTGDFVFPTYVEFNDAGQPLAFGQPARDSFIYGPTLNVVRHFKRLVGRPFDMVADRLSDPRDRSFREFRGRILRAEDGSIMMKIGSHQWSVVDITAAFLKHLYETAEKEAHRHGEEIEEVAVSVPAGCDPLQREATLEAARKAGLPGKPRLIEEPTCAAIAYGLAESAGTVLVVDVGAGTTDVVMGHGSRTEEGYRLVLTHRGYDTELGGMDMDNMLLEHVQQNDTEPPRLRDIYGALDLWMQIKLAGYVEDTKIACSKSGDTVFSRGVQMTDGKGKRIRVPITREQLNAIVKPLVWGFPIDNRLKGIRPVVEDALLKAAGGDKTLIPKVREQIQNIVLVGGPCRMNTVREMLADLFKDNPLLVRQITEANPIHESFMMEGVAQGAALSIAGKNTVNSTVPWAIGVFQTSKGETPVIPEQAPYWQGKGISRTVAVEVKQGTSAFSVLTHQNNQRSWDWGVHNHVVTVPEDGQLRITLNWGAEANQEVPVATVEGAGLPEPIIFPKIENRSTIGQEIEGGVRWSLEMLKQLRDVISKARSPLEEMAMRRTGNRDAARRTIDEMLHVPEMDLLTCDKLDPERFRLSDEDLQMALSEGYFPMHEKILKNKYAISEKALEVSQLLLYIIRSQDKSTVDDLIAQAKKLIGLSAGHSECMPYAQQMAKWLHRLEIGSNTTGDAAAAATSLGALADALFERRLIDVSEHENSNRICWRFQIGE